MSTPKQITNRVGKIVVECPCCMHPHTITESFYSTIDDDVAFKCPECEYVESITCSEVIRQGTENIFIIVKANGNRETV